MVESKQLHLLLEIALQLKHDFGKDVKNKNIMSKPAKDSRQRIYFNPYDKNLYLAEGINIAIGKAFKYIRQINPVTGKTKRIEMPFDAEDICFDYKGYIYLRTMNAVVRYDISKSPWREVPWDYGVEMKKVHTGTTSARKEGSSISALLFKSSDGGWHHGGMHVALNGNFVIGCINSSKSKNPFPFINYTGRSFAGRGGTPYIMVVDKYGKIIYKDFVPGLAGNSYGVGLDANDNVYLMSSGTRIYKGKRHYNRESGTIMKFGPKKAKIISSSKKIPLKLDPKDYLKRDFDVVNPSFGSAWVTGADWMYGGVGYSGKNAGLGCSCWNARFVLDYFNRSFAPETDRFSITMIDSSGNLITRIGTYGNADSQGPNSKAPLGGDEVGLMHGAYIAVDTDKRLFIADPANQRIVSVSLNYHKEEIIPLSKMKSKK